MQLLLNIVHSIGQVLSILVLASVLLSYFLPPDNAIRQFVDRIVNPLLVPIRKVVKPFGSLDFSPVILMIAIYIVESVLTQLILAAMR